MIDLFEHEQKVYDEASARVESGAASPEFAELTKEYGRMLKQLRRSTKIADRTTIGLHEDNIDLSGKVHIDGLTGIFNRRYMEDNLAGIINILSRSGGRLCVMMMDIDYFKKYNDTYGHATGDDCLREVAAVLKSSVPRTGDFVARYGGEEFAVILQNPDENAAKETAERILKNIRARNIPHEKNAAAPCVTISIGLAFGVVQNGQTGLDYIKRADEALYESKKTGRNRSTFRFLKGEQP